MILQNYKTKNGQILKFIRTLIALKLSSIKNS